MKHNPYVRFDHRHTELFGETSKQTPGGKAPGAVRSLTGDDSVSSLRSLVTASTESCNTFLTELEADGGEQRHVAQTARDSNMPQTARNSSSLHLEGDQHQGATGSQTARVQGSKYDRPKILVNKRRAQLNYLAIGAGDNVGDFYKPRAKNPGWNASVFPSSFSCTCSFFADLFFCYVFLAGGWMEVRIGCCECSLDAQVPNKLDCYTHRTFEHLFLGCGIRMHTVS